MAAMFLRETRNPISRKPCVTSSTSSAPEPSAGAADSAGRVGGQRGQGGVPGFAGFVGRGRGRGRAVEEAEAFLDFVFLLLRQRVAVHPHLEVARSARAGGAWEEDNGIVDGRRRPRAARASARADAVCGARVGMHAWTPCWMHHVSRACFSTMSSAADGSRAGWVRSGSRPAEVRCRWDRSRGHDFF